MESILIVCILTAVALLLRGYRRAAKQKDVDAADWLFAYKNDARQPAQTKTKIARD